MEHREATQSTRSAQLALDFIPAPLADVGLADAHHHPLVGERRGGSFYTTRTSPAEAWSWKQVEHRTATSHTGIYLDVDRPFGEVQVVVDAMGVPQPSVSIVRKANGHAHVAWFLEAPVHRYPHASTKPLQWLARVGDYYASTLGADHGYTGVLFRNASLPRVGFLHRFGRRQGWSLPELSDYIPTGWRRPAKRVTGIGRNCDTFSACMAWAGREENRKRSVWEAAMAANELNDPLLSISELRGIVRSVEKYRAEWEARGWHRPEWIAKQAARGRRSGLERATRASERRGRALGLAGRRVEP